jgi:Fe-S-cluster containining protein
MATFANLDLVRKLDVLPDQRSTSERRKALDAVRDAPAAREILASAIEALEEAERRLGGGKIPPEVFWDAIDDAYDRLDAYLAHLIEAAGLQVRCGPRCSACCTDVVPALPLEGLRLARELRLRGDGPTRLSRSVEYARKFQKLLLKQGPEAGNSSSEAYRRAQMEWRRMGQPCPILSDDGNCSAHAERPLACRAYFSVEDPSHCEPRHPRFFQAERPPVWSHPREHVFEAKLKALGDKLGLEPTPNLPWALARLHDHHLAEP